MSSRIERQMAGQFDFLAEHILAIFDELVVDEGAIINVPIAFADAPPPNPTPVDPAVHDFLMGHIGTTMEIFTPDYLAAQVEDPLGKAYSKGARDGEMRLKKASRGRVKVNIGTTLSMDRAMLSAHHARVVDAFDGIVRNTTQSLKSTVTNALTTGKSIPSLRNDIEHYFHREKYPGLHSKYMTTGTGNMSPRARASGYIRTTMADSYNTAARARYQPFTRMFESLAAGDCCDLCREIEDDNPHSYDKPSKASVFPGKMRRRVGLIRTYNSPARGV